MLLEAALLDNDRLEVAERSPRNRIAIGVLIGVCLLLVVEATTFMRTRWVEDESWMTNGAWTLLKEGSLRMPIFPAATNVDADVYPPLERLAMVPVFAAFGLGEIQARSVSALAAIATVVVIFLLAYEIAGPLCAAAAVVLLSTDNFVVVAARTARPEAGTALFCWLAVLLAYLAVRRDSVKLALVSGLAGGLSLLSHPLGFAFVVSIGLFYLWAHGDWRLWRQRMVWSFVAGVLVVMIPYALWCFSDAAHLASFRSTYFPNNPESLKSRIIAELDRWSEFVGLGSQRVSLPLHIPFRIHIVAAIVAAFIVLLRARRKLALSLLVLFLINLAWWLPMVNKTSRYIAVLAPIFAILFGAVLATSSTRRTRLAWAAVIGMVVVTQLAGNVYWIYKYRNADYPEVARQLQAAIPAGASVYSITTFWMALPDRTFYAYDRTPFAFARDRLKPEYVILYDRVMMQGSGRGQDEFGDLRHDLTELAHTRGTLVSRVSNAFYGDMEIYHVSW